MLKLIEQIKTKIPTVGISSDLKSKKLTFHQFCAVLGKKKVTNVKICFISTGEKGRVDKTVTNWLSTVYTHTHIHTYIYIHTKSFPPKNKKPPSNCTNTSYFDQKNRSWEEVQNAKSNDQEMLNKQHY